VRLVHFSVELRVVVFFSLLSSLPLHHRSLSRVSALVSLCSFSSLRIASHRIVGVVIPWNDPRLLVLVLL